MAEKRHITVTATRARQGSNIIMQESRGKMLLRCVLVFLATISCTSTSNITDASASNYTDIVTTNVTHMTNSSKANAVISNTTSPNLNGMPISNISDVSTSATTERLSSELTGNLSGTESVTPDIMRVGASGMTGNDAVAIDNASSADDTKSYQLPSDWSTFCHLTSEHYQSDFTPSTNLTVIKCHVTEDMSGVWKMADLRESMHLLRSSNTGHTTSSTNNATPVSNTSNMIGLEITCAGNSNISLSWPMKVHNLMTVKIRDCIITDYLNDSEKAYVEDMPDTLRVLELVDNVMMISIEHFVALMKNVKSVGREFDCGHDSTIEKIVTRNVSYDFTESMDVIIENLSQLGSQFMQDVKRIRHKCDYKHLLYLEEGLSSSTSKFSVQLQTDNSFFDVLQTLNMSNYGMTDLGETELFWFLSFPKLQLLDLSHNLISEIGQFEEPLDTDPSLRTIINIQHNNISTITLKNIRMFQDLSERVLIDIRNNPIGCHCSQPFKDVLDFIQDPQNDDMLKNGSFYSYLKQLTCASPEDLKDITLGSLSSSILCPEVTSYLIGPIIAISVTCVLLIVTLILLLRYRHEVTVFLFVRLNIVVPWRRRTSDDTSKLYDAFVSYSSREDDWVEEFFEDLERSTADDNSPHNRQTFKFCMHHRDFTAGKTIFDNVVKSVESSRHTIIILSKHYLDSEFCLYEFQQAFQQSIMEQKRHLVIVMCGEIPHEELPRDLKRCIKTFTYIRKDDFMFRSRLVYALSVEQQTKIVNKKSDLSNAAVKLEINGSSTRQSEKNKLAAQEIENQCSVPRAKASNVTNDKLVITIPLHEIIPSEGEQNLAENEESVVGENNHVMMLNSDTNAVGIDQCVCKETETLDTVVGVITDSTEPMRKDDTMSDSNEAISEVVNSNNHGAESANDVCNIDTTKSDTVIELHKHKEHELQELDTFDGDKVLELEKLNTTDRDTVLEIHQHNTNDKQNGDAVQSHGVSEIGKNAVVNRDVKIKIPSPETSSGDYIRLENVKNLNYVNYDRSMSEISYDTGYGSDRGSSVDHQLSLESCQSPCIDGNNLLASRINELGTM